MSSNSEDIICPECGKGGFASTTSMKIHYGKMHDGSIAGVEVECESCGEKKRVDSHEAEKHDKFFCGNGCRSDWQSENYDGEGNPAWVETGEMECEECGKSFRPRPYERGKRKFCSMECSAQWTKRTGVVAGENNPMWEGGQAELHCQQCGTAYSVDQHKSNHSCFCSNRCKWEWQSENLVGEKSHHWKGGNVEVVCEWCSSTYETYPCLKDRTRFCSTKCQGEWRSANVVGKSHPSWEGGKVTVECEQCKGVVKVKQSHAPQRRFCSNNCHNEWMSENLSGEKSIHWEGGKTDHICIQCGSGFLAYEESGRTHCSQECAYLWMSENLSGEDSPHWEGGELPYGAGWNEQKKELIRERDCRKCRVCGKSEAEHIHERGERLTVHHIVKARKVDIPNARNDPFNLVAMCRDHEAVMRIPECEGLGGGLYCIAIAVRRLNNELFQV